jgi:tetratricopeptide (TPR) repeat protein
MTREEFADAINRAIDTLFPGRDNRKHLYANSHWVGVMERGARRWTSDERRAALRLVTGATDDDELGLYPPRDRHAAVTPNEDAGAPTAAPILEPQAAAAMLAAVAERESGAAPSRADSAIAGWLLRGGPGPTLNVGDETPPDAVRSMVSQDDHWMGWGPGRAYAGMVERVVMTGFRTMQYAMNAGACAMPDTDIDQLTRDAINTAREFSQRPPAQNAIEALRVHDAALAMLERTRRPNQQERLYLIVSQSAALLAGASLDLGLGSTAVHYASAAYEYATIIDHRSARAHARGLHATILYWTGRHTHALPLAREAVELAPAGVATVRAQCVLARAWAYRGDVREVDLALQAAETARAATGTDELADAIGGEFGFSAPQQARCASTALLQVGQVAKATVAAAKAFQLAQHTADTGWGSVEPEARVDLATCQLLQGNPDAAHETLEPLKATLAPLWQMPADWRRTGLVGRVDRLQTLLDAPTWRNVTEARQLADMMAAFSAERPPIPALPPA